MPTIITKELLRDLLRGGIKQITVKITMTEGKTWCGLYDYAFARVAGVNVAVSNLGSTRSRFAMYCREVIDHNGSNYVEDCGSNKWARVYIKDGAEFTIKVNTDTLLRTLTRINKYANVTMM